MAELNAVAYYRVSGDGQIDGDGFTRQAEACKKYAATKGINILGEFRDEGVPGKTELIGRAGLTGCIEQCRNHGIKIVIVESADRLARDLIVAELLIQEFQKIGVTVISASGGINLTEGDASNPTAKLVRQILSAVAEFDRNVTVLKLRGARERKRKAEGRCEGVKPFGATQDEQHCVFQILTWANSGMSADRIALLLNEQSVESRLKTRSGKPWSAGTIRKIIAREKGR